MTTTRTCRFCRRAAAAVAALGLAAGLPAAAGELVATRPAAPPPATAAVTEAEPARAIAALRAELVDAFNRGDVDRLLSHLEPDVVATWQNGEVCRGPAAVRRYYDRMMTGPDRVVRRLTVAPTVDDRHVYDGAWAVSWGNLHDAYELTDGSAFAFDSRFTAAIARRGGAWKVTAFHASVSAFDNPILGRAATKVGGWAAAAGAAAGVAVGAAGGVLFARRRARAAAAAAAAG